LQPAAKELMGKGKREGKKEIKKGYKKFGY
jgi:hypothetical protein